MAGGVSKVWNIPRARYVGAAHRLEKRPQRLVEQRLSRDGRLALLGDPSDSNILWVWDNASGQMASRLVAPNRFGMLINIDAAFSPDEALLGTLGVASPDMVLRLWDVRGHRQLAELKNVCTFAWVLDGRTLLTVGPPADAAVSAPERRAFGHEANGPDNSYSGTAGVSHACLWEVGLPAPSYLVGGAVGSVAFRADSAAVAINDTVWKVTESAGQPVLQRAPFGARGLPEARSAGWSFGMRPLRDTYLRNRSPAPVFAGTDQVWDLVKLPTVADDPAAAVRKGRDHNAKGRDDRLQLRQLAPRRREVTLVCPTAEDIRFFESQARVSLGGQRMTYGGYSEAKFAVSPDGTKVLIAVSVAMTDEAPSGPPVAGLSSVSGNPRAGDSLELWDLTTSQRVSIWMREMIGGMTWDVVAFSGDGRHAITGSKTRGLEIWDVTTGKKERIAIPCGLYMLEPYLTPDWGHLLTVDLPIDGSRAQPDASVFRARLYDTKSGGETMSWPADGLSWLAFAVSSDGQWVASGGEGRVLHLWDAATGRELVRWDAHDAPITALAFSPDGKLLVSGGSDGTARVWNLPNIRRELQALNLDWTPGDAK
jgi:WD40 repeat protein